jgi:DNA-binding PucR family transcriptional regulator
LVLSARGAVWAWIARREAFEPAEVENLADGTGADLRLAVGEPGHGIAGWRLTHNQARAALAVALCGGEPVVRYVDVALLTAVVRDEVLATSLRRLYLEPLDGRQGGGDELRRTARAYFAAGRNVSLAGDAIGVSRQAVARRLRTVEEMLGRSIASCGPELELALRLEALESAPRPLSVP